MLHVLFNQGSPVQVMNHMPAAGTQTGEIQNRWDWSQLPFEQVEQLAEQLTALTGSKHVATRSKSSPKHDIIEVPKVGDPVSYGFNGDSYPDGTIVKISKKLMISTSTGNTYRFRECGAWVRPGGTWYLVRGHVSERNPHF